MNTKNAGHDDSADPLVDSTLQDGSKQDSLPQDSSSGRQSLGGQEKQTLRQRAEVEALVRVEDTHTERDFSSMVEHATDMIVRFDADLRHIYCNPAVEDQLGVPAHAWIGKTPLETGGPRAQAEFVEHSLRTALETGEEQEVEQSYPLPSGIKHFLTRIVPERDEQGRIRSLLAITRDITDRKQVEAALRRANRALQTIVEYTQLLARASDEATLLVGACRLLVEQGGYRMTWVGFAEQDEEKTVLPVAQFGFEAGYLDTVNITWADKERGRGPTGTAIRTGQPVLTRNIPGDPDYEPWREAAIRRGYASSIALPLQSGGRCFGAFNLYAAEPDAFDPEEVKLLTELANDLAYGIGALRNRVDRKQAEEALRESEEKLSLFMRYCPNPVYIKDENTRTVVLSHHFEKMLGKPLSQLLGKTSEELWPPELAAGMRADDEKV
ncbi:MAG: PAS domain-containing protein, partial [bacterium]